MKQIHKRLTYANVMASVAVFIALGGAAYAAGLPANSVGTKQLKNNAVTFAKIKNNAVTGAKVANGSLTGTQVNASTLGTVPNAINATNAMNAVRAEHAGSATNAEQLGGVDAGSYLRGTVTVVARAAVAKESFGVAKAVCPAGYQLVGGGVETENVLTVDVTDSTPLYGTEELPRTAGEGQHGPAGAWYGATHNTSSGSLEMSVTAICSPT